MPGDPPAPPAFAAAGPPREALAGFWRRLVSAFLDWLLVRIAAAAISDLFGVEGPSPPSADGDGVQFGLWMLWEPRKRTWHDMVAESLVVMTTFYPPGEFGRPAR